jgi:cytochrome c-type biogenesis protein CcmH
MNLLSSRSRRILTTGIAILLAFELMAIIVYSVKAQAQPTPSADEVNAVASQIYCPVCENITLDVCTTPACAQWREVIREKLAAGQSPAQIKAYFAAQYGQQVLAVPPHTGLNWLLYVFPPLIFLGALTLTVRFIHSHLAVIEDPAQGSVLQTIPNHAEDHHD